MPAPDARRVTLLMAIHCHQPVGNFGFVFEEAYAKAYEPFLSVLERHPGVRLALHYSGSLLDWLRAARPEFLTRVRALVDRGQVELLAAGYYEPILPLIPEADRQGQIAMMRAVLRQAFGTDPSGLWLTERVWEPDLPQTLSRAQIRYTMLDTNQFAAARTWLPAELQIQDGAFWDLLGCYTTDYAGSSVLVFPASKRLRYWMPFQRVEQTIEFLRRLPRAVPAAITFADDGEKFGLWPKTHHWVYEEGWLDQWCGALERERSWLRTSTFRDYVEEAGPSGRVYLPCGSYEEMLEWSGGYFRNFFTKYPEANAMQQKMLRVSRSIAELKSARLQASSSKLQAKSSKPAARSLQLAAKEREALVRQAQRELYAGQCNCAYWHGVFGGLYLAHLRRAVHAYLIAAERAVDQAIGRTHALRAVDADGDGLEEAQIKTAAMSVLVDPAEGGAMTDWSLPVPRLNLLDTLSRYPEAYHEKLKAKQLTKPVPASGVPASIHDVLGVKEPDLASHLVYDDHRRSAFLDYGLQGMPTLQELVRATWGERRLWSAGPFRWEPTSRRTSRTGGRFLEVAMVRELSGGWIRKVVRVATDRPVLECVYELEGVTAPVVALEFNVSLRDERYLSRAEERHGISQFDIQEPALGVVVRLAIDPPGTLVHFPIETVSESEDGLERTYQGLALMCLWAPDARGSTWTSRVRWTVDAPRR